MFKFPNRFNHWKHKTYLSIQHKNSIGFFACSIIHFNCTTFTCTHSLPHGNLLFTFEKINIRHVPFQYKTLTSNKRPCEPAQSLSPCFPMRHQCRFNSLLSDATPVSFQLVLFWSNPDGTPTTLTKLFRWKYTMFLLQ